MRINFIGCLLLTLLALSCNKNAELSLSRNGGEEGGGGSLNPQQIAEAQTAVEEVVGGSVSAILGNIGGINFNLDNFDWQNFLGGSNQSQSKDSEPKPVEVSIEDDTNPIKEFVENLEFVSYDKNSQIALFKAKADCDNEDQACHNLEKWARLGVNIAKKSLILYWNSVSLCELSQQNKSVFLSCSFGSVVYKHFMDNTLKVAPHEHLRGIGEEYAGVIFDLLKLNVTTTDSGLNSQLEISQLSSSAHNAEIANLKLALSAGGQDISTSLSAANLGLTLNYSDYNEEKVEIPRQVKIQVSDVLLGGAVKNGVFDELALKVSSFSAKDLKNSSALIFSGTLPQIKIKKEGAYLALNSNGSVTATAYPYTELIGKSGNGSIAFSSNKILFSLGHLLETGYLKPENGDSIQVNVTAGGEQVLSMDISEEKPLDGRMIYQQILSMLGLGGEQADDKEVNGEGGDDDKDRPASASLPEGCNIKLETKIFDQSDNLLYTTQSGASDQTSSEQLPYLTSPTLKFEASFINVASCPTEALSGISYKGYSMCGDSPQNISFNVLSSSSNSIVLEASNYTLPQDCSDKYSFTVVTAAHFDGYSSGFLYFNGSLNIDAPAP